MKRIFSLLTALVFACALTACGEASTQSIPEQSQPIQSESQVGSVTSPSPQSTLPTSPAPGESEPTADGESRVLVAYFSATGNTENIAQHIQTALDADLFEIVPEVAYTSEDLNYSDEDCRANQEQNDPAARPAISGAVENPERYDVVFLGYPIWWGQAPKIICTFLESYDFEGVAIVPFCTSGSSGIDGSLNDIQALASNAQWLDGQRFSGSASESEVDAWVDGLNLPESP